MKTTYEWAKSLYSKGYECNEIAEILNKNIRTIQNYKSKDSDWDKLRVKEIITDENAQEVYTNFTQQMQKALDEIMSDAKLNAQDKAVAIAKMGDSFAKMKKVAEIEDPKAYKLNIAQIVIKVLIDEIKTLNNESLNEHFKDFLSTGKIIKALEKANVL
ncbi:DUF1804 family protein [Campylobacter sp. RM9334]|uniref:DUF1804 family protein n=1 Tax=Campylobacter sp. RM9334 TaxID=2735732 RepID=UPI001E048BC7|nr:DUF1804 family protein [Campylobacter sp. RM9334]